MATPMPIVVRINGFCNCEGCIEKVRKALRDLGGVKMLAMNPEIGEFTISTSKHPEVIKFAIKQTFPKKDVTLSQQTNDPNQDPYNLITRQNPFSFVTPQGTADVHDIAKALVTVSHAKGLESVEFTQSNTIKINFTNRDQNQPSTSRSSSTLHNVRGYGDHVKHDGFRDVPPLPPPPPPPPPPPNATKPSAPLLNEDYAYGYPADLYGPRRYSEYDEPHGCCSIL